MGITCVRGSVTGPKGTAEVSFFVDSGATYTVLPPPVWRTVGLRATRTARFTLSDGSALERSVCEALISLQEGTAHSPVVLGEADDEALLGIVTLENIGLILNPFTRKLQPMRMILA